MKHILKRKKIPQEEPASKEKKQGRKLKRWQVGAIGVVCLLLAGAVSVNYFQSYIEALAAQTPLPLPPVHERVEICEDENKTQQYEKDLMEGKREESVSRRKNMKWERMRMAWNQIYGPQEVAEEESMVEIVVEAPKARIKRASRAATPPRKNLPVNLEKELITPSFNLKKGLSGNQETLPESRQEKEAPAFARFARAIIAGEQSVLPGERVKLRLRESIKVHGYEVPAHSSLSGRCSFQGGRVRIEVSEIVVGGSIVPVSLRAYDEDKTPGLAYEDARLRRQVGQQLSHQANQLSTQVPPTGIPLIDQLTYSATSLGKTIIRNTGQGRRTINLPDNYPLLLNLEL